MKEKPVDTKKLISYWNKSSDDDYDTMITLFNANKFSWALFVGHLMIEKLLKAYFVKEKNDYPPYIHNLLRLAELSGLELNEEKKLFFATVTAFNINARYDDYKMSFQNKCTPDYTSKWINELKLHRQWMKELIKK